MVKKCRFFLGFLLAGQLALPAVTLVSDKRYISEDFIVEEEPHLVLYDWHGVPKPRHITTTAAPGSPFEDFKAVASNSHLWWELVPDSGLVLVAGGQTFVFQSSTITSTRIRGSGYASWYFGGTGRIPPDGVVESYLETTFTVTTPQPYTLDVWLPPSPGDIGSFVLESATGGAVLSLAYTEDPYSHQGILQPGTYTLRAVGRSRNNDGYGAAWQFDFTALPVPDAPARWMSGLLLLFPVASHLARRSRRSGRSGTGGSGQGVTTL